MIRSEYSANLALAKSEQPTWTHASRCNRRTQHTALQIAQRHPSLFQRLFGYLLRK